MHILSRRFVLGLMIGTVVCLDVIPETIKLVYTNDKYVENVGVNIRRYGRKSAYYVNLWGTIKHAWDNNVSVHVILTEYLHNEYRRSFIELHYKGCDFVKSEPFLGGILKKAGITCPTPKGTYRFMNMTTLTQDFPNVFPFEKGGAEFEVTITDTGERVAAAVVHVSFRQKKKPRT